MKLVRMLARPSFAVEYLNPGPSNTSSGWTDGPGKVEVATEERWMFVTQRNLVKEVLVQGRTLMTRWLNPRPLNTFLALSLASLAAVAQDSTPPPGALLPNVLYGAAYYNEYMPADLQPGRLEKDIALMKGAGISVVRMGESTWSLW